MKRVLILCAIIIASCSINASAQQAQRGVMPKLESDYLVQPVQFPSVQITDSFWAPRQEINRKRSIPYAFDKCETTGRVSNFQLAAHTAPENTAYVEPFFNDSDLYKGIEAASFDLAVNPNPEMDAYLDRLIAIIGAAQESDGYLYTFFSKDRDFSQENPTSVGKRWHNIRWSHELYCPGHMYEAAAAHYIATGKTNFLDIAKKNADLICKTFGPNEGQVVDVPGHEVIEMGLIKLYRITGEKKYLDQAKFFVEMRGRADKRNSLAWNPKDMYDDYAQDTRPLTKETEAVGHAVRAVYFYEGAADVAAITKDKEIVESIKRIWNNVAGKKIYITGGLGGTSHGEAFAANYDLSNYSGYSETCAQIGGCGWHQRMFLLEPDAKYYDAIEQTIYNALISGVSLSGDKFFYPNQLASRGGINRAEWFGCACCPQNLMRFVASLGGYIYASDKDNLYVGLYIANKAQAVLNGKAVNLEMTGNYPWSGDVALTVNPVESEAAFCLNLRMPGWMSDSPFAEGLYKYTDGKTYQAEVFVNGASVEMKTEKGFLKIDRVWKQGDKIEIRFPLVPRWAKADDKVKSCRNRAALTRGPVVYTFESCDNASFVFDAFVKPTEEVTVRPYDKDFLGGVVALGVTGYYPELTLPNASARNKPVLLTAIPYCVWDNRGNSQMQVWMADCPKATSRPVAPSIANQSKISVSYCSGENGTRVINSLNDGLYPGDEREEDTYLNYDFWPHNNTLEWVQYDFAQTEQISKIGICWFDDAKRGAGCSTPKSWKILVQKESGEWVEPTNVSGYPIESEIMTYTTFDSIRAKAIRIELQLKENSSAGLYELSVE